MAVLSCAMVNLFHRAEEYGSGPSTSCVRVLRTYSTRDVCGPFVAPDPSQLLCSRGSERPSARTYGTRKRLTDLHVDHFG